jgi:hypothetical protein
MSKWRKFWQMGGLEQRWFVAALFLLPLVALGLRLLGLKRLQSLLAGRLPLTPAQPASHETAANMALAINRAAYHGLYRANCLQRSLLLWWLLRRRGIDSQLRIGVRRTPNRFEAHAWLEVDGRVVNDNPKVISRFAVFAEDIIGAALV